jgi:hypothetical protein
VLTDEQLRLYARQVILRELGQAGQARLCASQVAVGSATSEAARVAEDYLRRAGVQVVERADVQVVLPDAAESDPVLRDCTGWLCGAWAAVEAIKQCAGVGRPAAPGPLDMDMDMDMDMEVD